MNSQQLGSALAQATPSLALIKYWGKLDKKNNLPATPSIAITLKHLSSQTRVWAIADSESQSKLGDRVILDGKLLTDVGRFSNFFDGLRTGFASRHKFWVYSANNFPTAAGLASSSSGFAALAFAASRALGRNDSPAVLSGLARLGSGSAARSLYGGFTLLDRGQQQAVALHDHLHWPELRVLVVRISDKAKDTSSRDGMELSRLSSPYYQAWLEDAVKVCAEAQTALAKRDLEKLGSLVRISYLRMFSTMFSASPPFIYWHADSLAVIKCCEEIRAAGLSAWETMDAGPQVKIFCLVNEVDAILARLAQVVSLDKVLVDETGQGPQLLNKSQLLADGPESLDELGAFFEAKSRG